MIKLQFTGHRPFISPSGVRFIKGKPDKYVYIPSAVKLFLLLSDKNNWHGNKLAFDYPKEMLHDQQMLDVITQNDPAIIERVESELKRYDSRVDALIEQIQNSPQYEEHERDAYIKNIEMMRPYKTQRACNKILYHQLVKHIVKEIADKEIAVLDTPPTKSFYHLMDSIKGDLVGRRLATNVKVTLEPNGPVGTLRLTTNLGTL